MIETFELLLLAIFFLCNSENEQKMLVSIAAVYCCRYSLMMTHDVRDFNFGFKCPLES